MADETKETKTNSKKRSYHRKPSPPPPPSQAIVELENQIIALVQHRASANQVIEQATIEANAANAKVQAAYSHLKQIEQEVQYRMGLIQQMKGGSSVVTLTETGSEYQAGQAGTVFNMPTGVGSIPPAQPHLVQTQSRIRSETADRAAI